MARRGDVDAWTRGLNEATKQPLWDVLVFIGGHPRIKDKCYKLAEKIQAIIKPPEG